MILAADNLQTMNPRVAEAVKALDPGPIQDIARRAERAGADLLDLNPGYLPPGREDRMAFMVEAVEEVSSLRLILDSPQSGVLARGLAAARRTPILNAVSLEEHKLKDILPLAAEHGTDLVLLLMDERSFTPPGLDEKLALALELRERALEAGLSQERLIFDPVLPSLSWPDAWFRVAEAVRTIRLLASGAVFQDSVRTMAGLSNLRSGQRRIYPARLEETCLALLAGAGLDCALVDLLRPGAADAAREINGMLRTADGM
ncbi:MAG: dihydropteroate synthase [Proteobacteria bacterium]|nr:dihydropteroate synthase [Pseudomonadota bacterium]